MKKQLLSLLLVLLTAVSASAWTDLIVNGDAEGEYGDIPCAYSKEYKGRDAANDYAEIAQPEPAAIETIDGNKVFVCHAKAVDPYEYPNFFLNDDGSVKGDPQWQNEFWIQSPKEWKTGDQFRLSFRYKASKPAPVDTQCHGRNPGSYLHWNMLGSLNFTTEWQEFSKIVTVDSYLNGMWSIAFNLKEYTEDNDYYFDDIKWEEPYTEKGFFIVGDFQDSFFDYDNPVRMEWVEDEVAYGAIIGTDLPAQTIQISSLIGEDPSIFNANTLVPSVSFDLGYAIEEDGSWKSYKKMPGAKITLPVPGVWQILIDDVSHEIGAYLLESSEIIDGLLYEYTDETHTAWKVYGHPDHLLANVVIPGEYEGLPVREIGNYAFLRCSRLTSITIPESVKSIGNYAFSYCTGLTSVTIPNSVTSIGDYAFYYCSGLTSITIPSSVTLIGKYAFHNCSGLTSVTIPNSVTSIGDYAFYYCSGLMSVTIPNSLTSIGEGVFYWCPSLTSITIPESVTSIGNYAFSYCSGLSSVTIPNSVNYIGISPFAGCSGLTAFYGKFSSDDNRCLIVDSTLISFASCGLTEYTISDSVNSIGDSAFSGCINLTSVTIPNSVTSIGWFAFEGCYSLTSITIPNSISSIGYGAFNNCSDLTEVTCLVEDPSTITSIACFSRVPTATCTLYVPYGSKAFYEAAYPWYNFGNIVELPSCAIEVEDMEISPRKMTLVPVCLTNDEDITSLQFDIHLPEGLAIEKVDGNYNIGKTSRLDDTFVLASSDVTCSEDPITPPSPGNDNLLFSHTCPASAIAYWYNPAGLDNYVAPVGTFIACDDNGVNVNYANNDYKSLLINGRQSNGDISVEVIPSQPIAEGDVIVVKAYRNKENNPGASLAMIFSTGSTVVLGETNDGKGFNNLCDNLGPNAIAYTCTAAEAGSVSIALSRDIAFTNIFIVGFQITSGTHKVAEIDTIPDDSINNPENHTSGHNVEASYKGIPVKSDAVRVILFSSQNHTIQGDEGAVIEIPIVLADQSAEEGDTFALLIDGISITAINPATSAMEEVNPADVQATLTLGKRFVPGDVNDDGKFSVIDVSMTVAYVLGQTPLGSIIEAADVNEDGNISAVDVSLVVSYILSGRTTSPLRPLKGVLQPGGTSEISESSEYSESSDISVNADGSLDLSISGISAYTGAQFDIALPEGVAVKNVNLCGCDGTGHSVAFSQADGTARVLAFSPINRNFSADATFEIELDGSAHGNDGIAVDGIRLVEIAGTDITEAAATGCTADFDISGLLASLNRGIDIKATAGGVMITAPEECDITIADTLGRTLRHHLHPGTTRITLGSGVYFVNNKKVIIR